MPTIHRTRALVLAIALAFTGVAAATACEPPPPPPSFAACSNVGPFQCGVSYTNDLRITKAHGYARTTEPATYIRMRFQLEQRQADGTWKPIWWIDAPPGSRTQFKDYYTALISCERGVYRWHYEVKFDGHNTTYSANTATFTMYG